MAADWINPETGVARVCDVARNTKQRVDDVTAKLEALGLSDAARFALAYNVSGQNAKGELVCARASTREAASDVARTLELREPVTIALATLTDKSIAPVTAVAAHTPKLRAPVATLLGKSASFGIAPAATVNERLYRTFSRTDVAAASSQSLSPVNSPLMPAPAVAAVEAKAPVKAFFETERPAQPEQPRKPQPAADPKPAAAAPPAAAAVSPTPAAAAAPPAPATPAAPVAPTAAGPVATAAATPEKAPIAAAPEPAPAASPVAPAAPTATDDASPSPQAPKDTPVVVADSPDKAPVATKQPTLLQMFAKKTGAAVPPASSEAKAPAKAPAKEKAAPKPRAKKAAAAAADANAEPKKRGRKSKLPPQLGTKSTTGQRMGSGAGLCDDDDDEEAATQGQQPFDEEARAAEEARRYEEEQQRLMEGVAPVNDELILAGDLEPVIAPAAPAPLETPKKRRRDTDGSPVPAKGAAKPAAAAAAAQQHRDISGFFNTNACAFQKRHRKEVRSKVEVVDGEFTTSDVVVYIDKESGKELSAEEYAEALRHVPSSKQSTSPAGARGSGERSETPAATPNEPVAPAGPAKKQPAAKAAPAPRAKKTTAPAGTRSLMAFMKPKE